MEPTPATLVPPIHIKNFNCSSDYSNLLLEIQQEKTLKIVVGITCSLSVIGSLLIILSYILFKDLRTTSRLILFHLSLADFAVGFSNLFGDGYRFYRFAQCSPDQLLPPLTPPSVNRLCIAQAFLAHFSTISSVLWTMMLAAYMYIVVMKVKEGRYSGRWFMLASYGFCYGLPLALNLWMVFTGKLGFSPFNTSGWCGTIAISALVTANKHKKDFMAAILGYDLWIILTILFIIVIYIALHFYVRAEKKESSTFQDLIQNIDYKFIAIPVAFILLRVWSLLSHVLTLYLHHDFSQRAFGREVLRILKYLSGVGDSGQGAVNAIIFVMFTRTVRRRMLKACCWYCQRRRLDAAKAVLLSRQLRDDEDSDIRTSRHFESSNPVEINQSPYVPSKHMGSMATTTTGTNSPISPGSY